MYTYVYICSLSLFAPPHSLSHSRTSRYAHARKAYAVQVTALERAPEEAAAELLEQLAPGADSERHDGNRPQARASHEAAKSITRCCGGEHAQGRERQPATGPLARLG